ncbi:hypothetical protein ACHAPJ_013243 [Fusarium lateritium]
MSEQYESQLKELDQKHFVQLEEWTSLLLEILPTGVLFIFIDGLDECLAAERRALLGALMKLSTSCPSLRVFISSRDSVGVDLEGRLSHMDHVAMAPMHITSDIRLYVEATIQERMEDRDLVIKDPNLLNEIRDTLTDQADGIEVCTTTCDNEIRESLRSLPKDLAETFARALSRILSRQRKTQLVQKIFGWVAVAKRPLTLDEIREAISIDVGQPYTTPGKVVRELSPIISWCENLLQLTEDNPLTLQFAHSSVHEFITEGNLPVQLSDFHVDSERADHFAGEICVTYLHLNDFETTVTRRPKPIRISPMAMAGTALGQGSKVAELTTRFADVLGHSSSKKNPDLAETLIKHDTAGDKERFQQSHPFLRYASNYWIFHTANFQEGRSMTWTLWHNIATNDHALAQTPWQEAVPSQKAEAMVIWSQKAHHYSFLRYAHTLVEFHEMRKIRLMQASACEGDTKAIAIYLGSGYSTSIINWGLVAASGAGHIQAIEQLINADASVNPGILIETPLHAASQSGHYHVVEHLINAGANINGRFPRTQRNRDQDEDVYEYTPLHAASESGHVRVVEQLINAGAKIDAIDLDAHYDRRAPLSAPARRSIQAETPPIAASKRGHIQVVEQLLNAGAKINGIELEYEDRMIPLDSASRRAIWVEAPLYVAAQRGHIQVVKQLINAGANGNVVGRKGWSALVVASRRGDCQMVKQLIQVGADINVATKADGMTPLLASLEGNHVQVVKELLSAGADISVTTRSLRWRRLEEESRHNYLENIQRFVNME